jgi:hypothetical protein
MTLIPPKEDEPADKLEVPLRMRLSKAQAERVGRVCKETRRKQSDVIRRLLDVGLDAYDREQKGGKR